MLCLNNNLAMGCECLPIPSTAIRRRFVKCDLNTYAAQLEYAPEVWKKFHISIPRNEWSRALIWKVSIDTHIRHCDGLHDRLHALGRTLDRGKSALLNGNT